MIKPPFPSLTTFNLKFAAQLARRKRLPINCGADVEFLGADQRPDHDRLEAGIFRQARSDRQCLPVIARQRDRDAVSWSVRLAAE
jgi:hypothetical protein